MKNKRKKWRWVRGYKGTYRISNHGRIRSVDRYIEHKRLGKQFVAGRMLKQGIDSDGYKNISLCRGGEQITRKIHQLVLEAFDRPPDDAEVCRHLNGNRTDNRIENLRWGSVQQNSDDRTRHGNLPIGEDAPNSILTEKEVLSIRKIFSKGKYSRDKLANRFEVCEATIQHIITGRTWKHVEGPISPANPVQKIPQKQIEKIRRLYATGKYTQPELAERFGVTRARINRIVRDIKKGKKTF